MCISTLLLFSFKICSQTPKEQQTDNNPKRESKKTSPLTFTSHGMWTSEKLQSTPACCTTISACTDVKPCATHTVLRLTRFSEQGSGISSRVCMPWSMSVVISRWDRVTTGGLFMCSDVSSASREGRQKELSSRGWGGNIKIRKPERWQADLG